MNAGKPVRIAIYDLDRTITSLPTWSPFLLHAAMALAPWRLALLPVVGGAALARAVGLSDRNRLKETMHRLLLGPRLSQVRLDPVVARFAEEVVRDHIRPGARAQMAQDRAEGRRIVIASAAHRFYASAIADALGADDLIATEASRNAAGDVLPAIDGANCYGADKLRMIERWLAAEGIARGAAHIRFYSDHVTDAPTFDWADEAVAVNPHAKLRALAGQRGWRIVDWQSAGQG